jgi:hypothetical protein
MYLIPGRLISVDRLDNGGAQGSEHRAQERRRLCPTPYGGADGFWSHGS